MSVRELVEVTARDVEQLADVLVDCVAGGASVSFMHPLARERATAFWRAAAADVHAGTRALLVADDDRGICGTVQLALAMPDNQPHRADLAKLLVHRRARGRGLGEALVRAAETCARARGRTLLVLDTADATAARIYERCGWQLVGAVPRFALLPHGGYCATSFYYRALDD